jgi:hypothetical protein
LKSCGTAGPRNPVIKDRISSMGHRIRKMMPSTKMANKLAMQMSIMV